MTVKDFIKFWQTTAGRDLEVAEDLFKLGRYNYCLFFSHLALEKLLKGLVYKNSQSHALPVHNLVHLAKQARLFLTNTQINNFKEITSWNIQTRYDSYKFTFYNKATKEYTDKWFTKAKELYKWLRNQY